MRGKVVGKQDICIPLQVPFLEWQRPKGRTFVMQKLQIRQKSRGLSLGLTFILLSSPRKESQPLGPLRLSSLRHSITPHCSEMSHTSRRCGGNRNGAINICQQTVDILSPPPPIYVAPSPHAFMFCWASDSTTGRPYPFASSPPALWHSNLPIIAEVRVLIGFNLKSTLA